MAGIAGTAATSSDSPSGCGESGSRRRCSWPAHRSHCDHAAIGCAQWRPRLRREAERRLCSGRWLPFHARRGGVDASPRWRARRPDAQRRLPELRIVERSNPNEDQVRSSLGLAEQWCATARAEPAVHPIAAVRHARVVARRTRDREGSGAKAGANRSAACAQVLAIAAPTHPRGDRRFGALPTNGPAKATSCHGHVALHGKSHAASEIVLSAAAQRAVIDSMTLSACSRAVRWPFALRGKAD